MLVDAYDRRVTYDDVRKIALGLPEVEEGTWYGQPNFKVRRGRSFAGTPTTKAATEGATGDVLVVRVDMLEREALLGAAGDVYFITPHHEGYPWVLVRLERADPDEVRELLVEAWLASAPKRLAAEHEERLLAG